MILSKNLISLNKFIVFIITVFVIVNVTTFIKTEGNLYFYVILCSLLFFLAINSKVKVNIFMLWFCAIGFISILVNNIPDIFNPYSRFLAFIVIICLIGPLISNNVLIKFRIRIFKILNISIVTLVLISFLGIVLNLTYVQGRGGISGVFKHSMILGPMASISLLTSMNWIFSSKSKIKKIYFIIILIASFLTCIAAGSRAALFGGLIGLIFYLYKIYHGHLTKIIKIIFPVVIILIFTFPLWGRYSEQLVGKFKYAKQRGSYTITRENLWKQRLTEFKSSPLIGIGFASIDISKELKYNEQGTIEPGSSWLAILSMTGILGFIPLLILIFKDLLYCLKDKINRLDTAYLGGLLTFFIIHMFAEGYIFAAGSSIFFIFWLLLGVLYSLKSVPLSLVN